MKKKDILSSDFAEEIRKADEYGASSVFYNIPPEYRETIDAGGYIGCERLKNTKGFILPLPESTELKNKKARENK